MTLVVSHREGEVVVLDAIREVRPPFSPKSTISVFSALLKTYRIVEVVGDRFGGEFPREVFRHHGINYKLAELSKSQCYIESLPTLNAATVRLLDNERLVSQLCNLERKHSRAARDLIDHPPRGHDDVANAAMLACYVVHKPERVIRVGFSAGDGSGPIDWVHRRPEQKLLLASAEEIAARQAPLDRDAASRRDESLTNLRLAKSTPRQRVRVDLYQRG